MMVTKIFEKVLADPEIHVGQKSLTKIKAFIDGYRVALDDSGKEFRDSLYDGFQNWVAKKLLLEVSRSWAAMILFMSGDDEAFAVERTKQLWNEYKSETQIKDKE